MNNWITKIIKASEKIKTAFHERATAKEIAASPWTSCTCMSGPMLKKDLKANLFVCPSCQKHHRISPKDRFSILFSNDYEIIKTPVPKDDILEFVDTKSYKDRLKSARKNTGLDCSMVVATGAINKINITAIASEFGFLGASVASAEGEAFLAAAQHAIENKHPLVVFTAGGGMRMQEGMISLSQMPRTTLVTENQNYLHFECRSRLFRFVDDLEFLIDPDARVIQVRSASRVGYSDLGVNRARVNQVRVAFESNHLDQ